MLQLTTLGRLSLANSAASVVGLSRRKLAILALLASAGDRGLRRDKLVAYLWPESSSNDARHSLEQLLYSLRRQLDARMFDGTDPLRLNPQVITSDLEAFHDAIRRGSDSEAIAGYQGDFLDGFYLTEASEFERWVEEERSRLRLAYTSALERAAAAASQRGDRTGAVAAWRTLAGMDPLSARYANGLVRAIASAGDVPEALRTSTAYERLLRRELNLPPDDSMTTLVQELRSTVLRRAHGPDGGDEAPVDVELEPAGPVVPNAVVPVTTVKGARRTWVIVIALGVATLLVPGTVWLVQRWNAPEAALPRTRVVVAVFENRTGDSTIDKLGVMAADYTRNALARTGLLDVISPSFDLWNVSNARPEHRWSRQALVRQTGATLLISGAIYDHGRDTLEFAAEATDARGLVVFAFDSVWAQVHQPRLAIEQVRQRVMSAIATLVDTTLSPWAGNASSPPVLFDAYQQFAEGMISFVQGILSPRGSPAFKAHYAKAMGHLERAYQRDSTYFVSAIWWIFAETNVGNLIGANTVIRRLAPRRGSMSPYERALYEYSVSFAFGTPEQRYRLDRMLVAFGPASEFKYCQARDALLAGRTREALGELTSLDTSYSWAKVLNDVPSLRMRAHAQLHQFDAALAIAKQVKRAGPGDLTVFFPEIDVLSATRRFDEIERVVDNLAAVPGVSASSAANAMLYAGLRLQAADSVERQRAHLLFERARVFYDRASAATSAPDDIKFGHARSLYYLERWGESRRAFLRMANATLGSTPYDRRVVMYLAALAVRRGDTAEVANLRQRLQQAVATGAEREYFNARIAALRGMESLAIQHLDSAITLGAQLWETVTEGDAAPSMDPDFRVLYASRAYRRVVALW